jgi:hypothetical protein
MTLPRILVLIMVVEDIIIAVAYLINKQPGVAWYWLSAGSISCSFLLISK